MMSQSSHSLLALLLILVKDTSLNDFRNFLIDLSSTFDSLRFSLCGPNIKSEWETDRLWCLNLYSQSQSLYWIVLDDKPW